MELNNNNLVAIPLGVKEEVLAYNPVAADSQEVKGAGEVRKEEMLEVPADEIGHEDPATDESCEDSRMVEDEVVDPYDPATNLMLDVGEEDEDAGEEDEDAGEDSDESSILVSFSGFCFLLFQLAASQDVTSYYGPGGEGWNAPPLEIAAEEGGDQVPGVVWEGGDLPPRFVDTSEEEAE